MRVHFCGAQGDVNGTGYLKGMDLVGDGSGDIYVAGYTFEGTAAWLLTKYACIMPLIVVAFAV